MPPPITYKTVTMTYKAPDGTAGAGSIRFMPSVAVLDSSGSVVITKTPLTEVLNGAGYGEIDLPCTDVAGTSPTGWVWQCKELFSGGREFEFSLPTAGGSTVDLSTLVTPETTEATYSYALQATVQALDDRVDAVEASAGLAVAAVVIHPFVMSA